MVLHLVLRCEVMRHSPSAVIFFLAGSDDMGNGRQTSCPNPGSRPGGEDDTESKTTNNVYTDNNHDEELRGNPSPPIDGDYASWYLPLVYQEHNRTRIVEQPLDFTTLAEKYNHFATKFTEDHQDEPFLLYVPFSHVHATSGRNEHFDPQPNHQQYASCPFQGKSKRGAFGDALSEIDWMVGNVHDKLKELDLEENTLIVFTSDNGPWNAAEHNDGGSYGIFSGRSAGYPWTGKASTWEGGIREPAFAYFKGQIEPFSRSSETISSMDVFPTFSRLAGVPLPPHVTLDGRDMTDILLRENGKSKHDFLFIYGFCNGEWPRRGVTAVRHGPYKAHFCTAPGLGGNKTDIKRYDDKFRLLFNVEEDPSEAFPICTGESLPKNNPKASAAIMRIMRAYAMEKATFEYGNATNVPDGPGEGPHRYGLCCDRASNCSCTTSQWDDVFQNSIFRIGSREHHSKYHEVLGETNHMEGK